MHRRTVNPLRGLAAALLVAACGSVEASHEDLESLEQAASSPTCPATPADPVCSAPAGDPSVRSACFVSLGGETFRKEIAQTFTVARVDYAGRVRLTARRLGAAAAGTTLNIELRKVDANGKVPTDSLKTFAQGSLDAAALNLLPLDVDSVIDVPLDSGAVEAAGVDPELSKKLQLASTYAVIVRIPQPGVLSLGVACHTTEPYAGGQAWTRQLRKTGGSGVSATYSGTPFTKDKRDLAFTLTLGDGLTVTPPATLGTAPDALPALDVWLQSESLVLADGAPVTSWQTIVPSRTDTWTQGTAALRPILRTNVANGRPVVRFDAIDDKLVSTYAVASGSVSATVVYSSRTGRVWAAALSAGLPFFMGLQYSFHSAYAAADFIGIYVSPLAQTGVLRACTLVSDAGLNQMRYYADGTQRDTFRTPATLPTIGITLGNAQSAPFDGDIAAVTIHKTVLTPAQITALHQWLAQRYGFTLP